MRIAHYSDSLYAKGGVLTYVNTVSREQTARGNEVLYISLTPDGKSDLPGIRSIAVTSPDGIWDTAAKERVDVLHVHSFLEWKGGALSFNLADVDKVPKVVRTVHNHEPYCPSGTRYLFNRKEACERTYNLARCLWGHYVDGCGSRQLRGLEYKFRRTTASMEQANLVSTLTVSEYLRSQMVRSGYNGEMVRTLLLPIEWCLEYEPPPLSGIPHFLYLGRLVPTKGVDWLLKALTETTQKLHIDIAGEGYASLELQRLCKELGAEDKVTFHGWMDKRGVQSLISGARALVFPSLWPEPAGYISLEAGLNGRAVVGSKIGAMQEYIDDGKTGLLITPNDSAALARSLDLLATDYHLACELGRRGREHIRQRFLVGDHCDRLQDVYAQTK